MKTEEKKDKKKAPKKKLGRLDIIKNTPVDPSFKNLHLLLEPHEIPVRRTQ